MTRFFLRFCRCFSLFVFFFHSAEESLQREALQRQAKTFFREERVHLIKCSRLFVPFLGQFRAKTNYLVT